MSDEIKLRWIVEEDGTKRLQVGSLVSYGGARYCNWTNVEEVPASEEYADADKPC